MDPSSITSPTESDTMESVNPNSLSCLTEPTIEKNQTIGTPTIHISTCPDTLNTTEATTLSGIHDTETEPPKLSPQSSQNDVYDERSPIEASPTSSHYPERRSSVHSSSAYRSHQGHQDHPAVCQWEGCTWSVENSTELMVYKHTLEVHAVSGKQMCMWKCHPNRPLEKCHTSLRNRGQFIDHISVHFTPALKPFVCQTCGETFRNRQTLQRHKLAVHEPGPDPSQPHPTKQPLPSTRPNLATIRPMPDPATLRRNEQVSPVRSDVSHDTDTDIPHLPQRRTSYQLHDGYTADRSRGPPRPEYEMDVEYDQDEGYRKRRLARASFPSTHASAPPSWEHHGTAWRPRSSVPPSHPRIYSPPQSVFPYPHRPVQDMPGYVSVVSRHSQNSISPTLSNTHVMGPTATGTHWKLFSRYFNYISGLTGVVAPKKWAHLVQTARESGGYVASSYFIELCRWLVSEQGGRIRPDDVVNLSISLLYNNYKAHLGDFTADLLQCIRGVQHSLLNELEYRRKSTTRLSDSNPHGLPPMTVQGRHPPVNPLRELLLHICRTLWRCYCQFFNDDVGQVVELAPSNYRRQNCRDVMMGFRVMCPLYESHSLSTEIRKLAAITFFNLLNEVFDSFIQNHVWETDDMARQMTQLCCNGFVCRPIQGDTRIRGGIQVVELQGAGIIAWIKLGSDRQFISTGPPHALDPVIYLPQCPSGDTCVGQLLCNIPFRPFLDHYSNEHVLIVRMDLNALVTHHHRKQQDAAHILSTLGDTLQDAPQTPSFKPYPKKTTYYSQPPPSLSPPVRDGMMVDEEQATSPNDRHSARRYSDSPTAYRGYHDVPSIPAPRVYETNKSSIPATRVYETINSSTPPPATRLSEASPSSIPPGHPVVTTSVSSSTASALPIPIIIFNNRNLTQLRPECLWEMCTAGVFESEEHLYQHLLDCHAISGKQVCRWKGHPSRPHALCQSNLRNRGQFVDHISVHFSLNLKPFLCQQCGEKFRNRQTLQRHKMSVHQPTKENDQYYYAPIDETSQEKGKQVKRASSLSSCMSESQKSNDSHSPYPLSFHVEQQGSSKHALAESSEARSSNQSGSSTFSLARGSFSSDEFDGDDHYMNEGRHNYSSQLQSKYSRGVHYTVFTRYIYHMCAVSGIMIPQKWIRLANAASEEGGFIPAQYQMELDDWFIQAHPDRMNAEKLLNFRISLYYNNSKTFLGDHIAKLIDLIDHLKQRLLREAERRASSGLTASRSGIGFPSQNNSYRELILKMCSMLWRNYQESYNDDEASLVELNDAPLSCRGSMLGLRIVCPAYEYNKMALEMRKLVSITFYNILNEAFHHLVSNYVWNTSKEESHCLGTLCCQGQVCGQGKPSGSIQVVEMADRPGIIVWFRIGLDAEWVASAPPSKATPVYLVKNLTR